MSCLCLRCIYVSELLLALGLEDAVVETTDVGERITEQESLVATKELTSEVPAVSFESTGKLRIHSRHTHLKVNTKQCFII